MRAARIHAWNRPPVLEQVPEPVRAPGQTLVRLEAATVSHLDITVQTGEFGLVPALPYVPGCEGAGIVVESDTLARGTQVIFADGAVGLDRDGTWREYATAPDELLLPLEPRIDPRIAATFCIPATTAAVTLFEIGRLRARDTVLVSGATGAVGSLVVQLALNAGAQVIGLVSRTGRLAVLPPGVVGVAVDDPDATACLARDRPADLLVDTIGGPGLGGRIGWVKAGGAAACLGYTAGTEFTIDLPNWLFASVAILPVNLMAYEAESRKYAAELLPKFADGTFTIATEAFTLDRAAEALDRLRHGRIAGRAVITF